MGKKNNKKQRSAKKTFLLGNSANNSSEYLALLNNPWNMTSNTYSSPNLEEIQAIQEVESIRRIQQQERDRILKEEEELVAKQKADLEYLEFQAKQRKQAHEINKLMRDILYEPTPSSSDSEFFGKLHMRSYIQLGHKTSAIMSEKHPELTHTVLGPFLSANSHNPMAIWDYVDLAKYREEACSTYRSLGGRI